MTIEESAKTLGKHLNDPHSFMVGIGDNKLVVYRTWKGVRYKVPKSWEGWPVETRYTGPFRLAGA